ncbi:prospore membrane adapter protein Spo71p [[Candida] anglica]|uniref:Prospore membrane adapter protein Spo71p n=1 Tax=[Candida] anglica TaxID=148631 RepID=A0ABP0E731_9ASCO
MAKNIGFTKLSNDEFQIPKESFTACKLSYGDIADISEASKCDLLGGVPDAWYDKANRFNLRKLSQRRLSRNVSVALNAASNSIRRTYQVKPRETRIDEGIFNIFAKRQQDTDDQRASDIDQVTTNDNETNIEVPDEYDNDDDDDHYYDEFDAQYILNSSPGTSNRDSSNSEFIQSLPNPSILSSPMGQIDTDGTSPTSRPSSEYPPGIIRLGDDGGAAESSVVSSKFTSKTRTLRFASDTKIKSRSNGIDFLPHEPTEVSVQQNAVRVDKDHYKMLDRIRTAKNSSKKRAKRGKRSIESKIVHKLLKKFHNGEIIKMNRMLVLLKVASKVNTTLKFEENEPCDTRIYERWREYYVVLRKSGANNSDIEMQLYDVFKSSSQDMKKPDISFKWTDDIQVRFYSAVDKTISIAVPSKDKGMLIYILQCHDQTTSYRWLFFLSQISNHDLDSSFHVQIPHIDLALTINIPEDILGKELISKDVMMKVTRLELGYSVEYTTLLRYLKSKIITELSNIGVIRNDTSPKDLWLCFKYYDRIEWIPNNGHMLYLQNILKSKEFQLQLIEKTPNPRTTTLPSGTTLREPVTIEGFLSRLTDIFGDESTLFKQFFKMSYFYSCDNILFYTKFFRGLPPSPNNDLMNPDCDVSNIVDQIPNIYTHSAFPIDENHHLSWLNEKEFDKGDMFASSELERRVHQIIKAEGMIDMCLIKDVRKMDPKRIKVGQKLLLSIVWYSSALIEDEAIIDSGFEIELIHGSVLRLQAPNREIRDEWVTRLLEMKTYWTSRKQDDVNMLQMVRQQNKHSLNIREYADSNITQEAGFVELQHSIADPRIYNMDCLSINHCVLMSGYLYMKSKKHGDFIQYFVVMCPGFLLLFRISRRSKVNGVLKVTSCFEHYMTIPINECYIYSGESSAPDLLISSQRQFDSQNPGRHQLPRLYADGWRSSEEEPLRCFTLWVGRKRNIIGNENLNQNYFTSNSSSNGSTLPKNPGVIRMIRKLGLTGRTIVFMARSRQERELWVSRFQTEFDRFTPVDEYEN